MGRMMRATVLVAMIAWSPCALDGQDLTGRYVFQGGDGPVDLVLAQEGATLRGTLQAPDGSVFRLEGRVEAGRSTGDIALGDARGWYAVGPVDGGLKMVVAELDGAGAPDLSSAWELDFTRVAGAPAASAFPAPAASTAPAPAPPAPTPSAPGGVAPQREDTPLLREWLGHIRGKRLTYMDSYSSSDASGYGGYSDKWEADVCSDGTFFYRSRSMVTADVGGVGGYSGGSSGTRGMWRLVEHGGQAVLQYRMEDGTEDQAVLSYRDGKTYFGDQRVFVTPSNQSCP